VLLDKLDTAKIHWLDRLTCRARRVEPCCSTSSTQPKCMGSTRRTCRVVSRCDVTSQVEFGLMRYISLISRVIVWE